MPEENNNLEYSEWYKRGDYMVRRSALPLDHPESIPSLWIKKFGDLDGFPWEEVFGRYPTDLELIRSGFLECPICKRLLK